jgi:phosphate-selective porin
MFQTLPSRVPGFATSLLFFLLPLSATAQEQGKEPLPAPSSPEVGYDGGFFIRSADGRNEFVIEGLMQVDARYNGRYRTPETEFDLARIRPEFAGRLAEHYRFKIEPNFGAHEVELEEAWAGMDLAGGASRLMLGRMKAPFGLEEVRSRRHMPFSRFSIMNQFQPAEQHGVFLNGRKEKLEYGFALYNGGGGDEGDDGKEVAARAMIHPFAGDSNSSMENLQIGLAATYGSEDRSVGGKFIKNASNLPLIEYADSSRLDGDQWRAGLEGAWYRGPWMLQAEWMRIHQEMNGGTGVDFDGGYVAMQHVLTGESVSFKGVRPANPFDPGEVSGSGAWVLALRASTLSNDAALRDSGLVLPSTYTGDVHSLWVGLNWYLGEHAILRNSYVHSFYSDEVGIEGSGVKDEGAVLIQFQLHF